MISTPAFSQEYDLNKGVKGGLNLAKIVTDGVDKTKILKRYILGGYATFPINATYEIQTELLYSIKGGQLTDIDDSDVRKITTIIDLSLTYIDIPLLFKYIIPNQSLIKKSFYLGPSLSYFMGAKSKIKVTKEFKTDSSSTTSTSESSSKESTKLLDYSFVIGLGTEHKMDKKTYTFDLRYSFGLLSFDTAFKDKSFKNSVIGVLIGYQF